MATEQRHVIHADDLTDADEAIIGVLASGARTKGAIEDETGLHRNTVGNRLDVLEAGDVVERIHDRTALYELVDDPRDATDEAPIHLGTLERAASMDTEDGAVLLFETDEGEFLIGAESEATIDNLSVAVDMFWEDFSREGDDA